MFTSQALPPGLLLSAMLASICLLLSGGSAHAQTMPPTFAVTLDMQGTRLASHQAATPKNAVQEIKLKQHLILQKDGHFRSVSESVWPGNIKFHFLSSGNRDGVATVDLLQWRQGVEIEREDAKAARNAYADFLFLSPALLLEQVSQPTPRTQSGNEKYQQLNFNDAAGRPGPPIGSRRATARRYIFLIQIYQEFFALQPHLTLN